MDLGTRIKLWREMRSLSQRALAAKLDVTPAAVSYWESGSTSPTAKNIAAIAEAFGLTIERFYGVVPKMKRKRAAA